MQENRAVENGLLIDLDGVIYQSDRIIDGALATLDWIRQSKIPRLFVTNTTSRSRAELLQKFAHLGFEVELEEVMTPIVAARQYLGSRHYQKIAAFVTPGAAREFSEFEIIPAGVEQSVDAAAVVSLARVQARKRFERVPIAQS
jgi:phospholysine phosphohistidine inorganic pyrophosphate phosphatase